MHLKRFLTIVCLIFLVDGALAQGDISLDFDLVPEAPYYLGSEIEKIQINAFYSDGLRVPLENWGSRPYLNISGTRKSLDLREVADGSLEADLNYRIEFSEEFLMGGDNRLRFELMDMVNDKFGNYAGNVQKEFEIEKSHPSLRLRIRSPPSNERLFQNLEIPFEIELIKEETVKNEMVFLVDSRDLENKRACRKVKEEVGKASFQCIEKVPSMDEATRIRYLASASADIGGQQIWVFETSENEIGNTVRIELEFPQERAPFNEVENRLEANFWYNPSTKLEGGSYPGAVNGTPIEFVWDAEEKAYVAEFDLKGLGEGEHELEFAVEGMDLEDELFEVEFLPADAFSDFGPVDSDMLDPVFLIGLIVAVFALFTFIVWFLVLRKRREETHEELRNEAARLKELLKRIEIDYYKRRLNEVEYKKRALEYQTRLDEIIAKIKTKGIAKK